MKSILTVMVLSGILLNHVDAGFCLQKPSDNTGWCAEDIEGRGVCIIFKPSNDSTRCFADQPDNQTIE